MIQECFEAVCVALSGSGRLALEKSLARRLLSLIKDAYIGNIGQI